jgi:hypothetical protein
MLEQSVIDLLAPSHRRRAQAGRTGVYVADAKVAALGLRVSRGRAYHGIALNVDMDLSPFASIDPCGYRRLARDPGARPRRRRLGGRARRAAGLDPCKEARECVSRA